MSISVIPIKGMSCMGCVNSIKSVLEKIPGVTSVEVSLDQAQATIHHESSLTDHNVFRQAIEEAGFEAAEQ
ncbi:MAG TPA: heavy metal-associated domain-containing protein [Nitrosomonas halophila]|nr:heavy metal-associated domain-containing protein [Nitrosomonas halophila]